MEKKTLTALGATMLALAAEAGVYKYNAVRARLAAAGLSVSAPAMSAWLYGDHAAPKDLCPTFAEAFDLDAEKKIRLAVAYAYGQTRPASEIWLLPETHQASLR